ncbi:tRNA isopentenyltransferase [Tanacetum coccineum]
MEMHKESQYMGDGLSAAYFYSIVRHECSSTSSRSPVIRKCEEAGYHADFNKKQISLDIESTRTLQATASTKEPDVYRRKASMEELNMPSKSSVTIDMGTQIKKQKVIFIMGATATGKSRLSVDIAVKYSGEIINCDKMQVYRGLNIVTNKITEAEMKGVPHHLLGNIDPESDFTAQDFCYYALAVIKRIVRSGKLPVIVGGSNSFIEALVEDPVFGFRSKYECCFLWTDVSSPVLYSYVGRRVDQMVDAGLVDEVRDIYDPMADYTIGIRKSIGVPELHEYLQWETKVDHETAENLLNVAISDIKSNTCKLTDSQLSKIYRLRKELRWPIHRVDATNVFLRRVLITMEYRIHKKHVVFIMGATATGKSRLYQKSGPPQPILYSYAERHVDQMLDSGILSDDDIAQISHHHIKPNPDICEA